MLSDMVLGTIHLEDVSPRERSVCVTCIPRERILVSLNLFTFQPEIKTHERLIGVEERRVSVCR
jgi:hypothetical protein